jgi:signal transduction histidine kinase
MLVVSRRRRESPAGPLLAGTALAVGVCAVGATVLAQQLHSRDAGFAPQLGAVLQVVASALFLGAGVLRVARHRIEGDPRSLRMGVALVLLGGVAYPLTSLAGYLSATAGDDGGSMLRAGTALITIGLTQLAVFRAITTTDHDTLHAGRMVLVWCGTALVLFVALAVVHALWPMFVHAETLPPVALRGSLLAIVWLYVGLEAALRSDERPWAGKVAPLLGGMGVSELLRVVSAYHPGAWELAATGLMATIAATAGHRALLDLDESTHALKAGSQQAAEQHAWREEMQHDACNALAGLRAALQTLQKYDGVLDAGTSVRLRTAALGEISHLEHLIIRSDPGELVDFDLADVVAAVVDTQRANGAEVTVDVPTLRVHGRPGDLATALQNLVVNARDHGGNRITVRAVRVGDRIEVLVSDRGPGLTDSQLATLFQRGARGPESTGSGLGLHVSRTLMRQQGGDLVLREHVAGATFALVVAGAAPVMTPAPTPLVRRAELAELGAR